MEYANRDLEFQNLQVLVQDCKSPIFIDAYHASGVSSFIQDKMAAVWESKFSSENIFFVDGAATKSLVEQIFDQVSHSEHVKKLQKLADKQLGRREGSALSASVGCVPYAGSLLSYLFGSRTAAPIYAGSYPSAIEEYLIPFFESDVHSSQFLLVIDAVERLSETSFDFLARAVKSKAFYVVLIRTENTSQYAKIENFLSVRGINTEFRVAFDRPQVKLVKELGSLYGLSITTQEAEDIIKTTAQNIHEIIRHLRSLKDLPVKSALTPWEKGIISVIDICSGSIDEASLIEIVKSGTAFALDPVAMCRQTLKELAEQRIIAQINTGWVLLNHHDPAICQVLDNISDQLIYKNLIYSFLCQQNDDKNAKLRYQLSKDIGCTTPEDARILLRQLVISGEEVSDDIFLKAKLVKGERDHCLLAGIRYCRERNYENSLMWIDAMPAEQMTDDIMAFRATLLNRTRQLSEAEIALVESLKRRGAPARQNLLGAFLISNYVHQEKLDIAQNVFQQMRTLYPGAPMHGYLVRNAISAFKEYRSDLYEQALSDFQAENDDFGYYTTLCNQGYSLCKASSHEDALELLMRAKEGMESFSQSNLHIVYNDLGICLFYMNRMDDAFRYLSLASKLGRNIMPTVFSKINLACLMAVMGQTPKALEILDSVEGSVRSHKLDRMRQKYYPNRLMVEYLHGNKNLDSLITLAKAFPDRYFPEKTVKAIRVYDRFAKSSKPQQKNRWQELFSPCGLTYWYMEPLKLLPPGII